MLSGVYQILTDIKTTLDDGLTTYVGKYACRLARIEEAKDEQLKQFGVYLWLNTENTKFEDDQVLQAKTGNLAVEVGIQFESENRYEEACQFSDAVFWLIQEKRISGHYWNWNGSIEEVSSDDETFKGYKFVFTAFTTVTQ